MHYRQYRKVLHAFSIRETQSARSNIFELTIASPPSHSHNNVVYICVLSIRPQDSLPGTITMSKFRLIFIQYPYSIGISLIVESLERTPCRRVGDEPKMYKCGRAANQTCMSRDYFWLVDINQCRQKRDFQLDAAGESHNLESNYGIYERCTTIALG